MKFIGYHIIKEASIENGMVYKIESFFGNLRHETKLEENLLLEIFI